MPSSTPVLHRRPRSHRRLRLALAAARDRLLVSAYRLGWGLVRALPEPIARTLFRVGADLAWRRGGKGVRRLRSNLIRVAGPDTPPERLDALTRAGLRSYARYWLEVFRLPVIPPEVVLDRMTVHGEHRIDEAKARGKGLIIALAHSGNWDHAGAWLVRKLDGPFTTVAERLEPAEVFDRFVAFRESLGMEVLPLTGGTQPPSHILAERLRANGVLCLLADRDLSAAGVRVQFFGETATMPAGPAHLALTTGATLVPAVLWFEGNGWAAHVAPPIPHTDIATMTQAMADAFAADIAAHPQDWHMLQRLWQADLSPTRVARSTPPADGNPSGERQAAV